MWAVLVGIGAAVFPVVLTLIGLRARTSEGTAALSGFTQSVGYLISAIGPFGMGALRGLGRLDRPADRADGALRATAGLRRARACRSAPVAEAPEEPYPGFAAIADMIAFIHLLHWPVAEPERMRSVLAHLEAIPPLSRENWTRILAETDNGKEWLPNPRQTGFLPGVTVTQEQIDGWMLFLDEFEALLKGEKLLPHWRFDKGINLRRIFLEPTTFDVVLLIQGSAAIPYLEDGSSATGDDLAADRRPSRRQFHRLRDLVQLRLSDAAAMWTLRNAPPSPFGRKVQDRGRGLRPRRPHRDRWSPTPTIRPTRSASRIRSEKSRRSSWKTARRSTIHA